MKHLKGILCLAFVTVCGMFQSCTEDIDTSSRYVFKESTLADYLQKYDQYSEYTKLLNIVKASSISESSVMQLLSARGHYTVFAPTNEAIQQYLDSLAKQEIIPEASWDAFTDSFRLDSVRQVIVYNSIIDSGDDYQPFEYANFPEKQDAEFSLPNMYDRKLTVHYCDNPDSVLVNNCYVDARNHDILCINGVIHCMHEVIAPSNNSLSTLFRNMIDRGKGDFQVMARLVKAVGMLDTLDKIRDDVYEQKYQSSQLPEQKDGFYTPQHRYYGYTVFAETDEFWTRELGKPVNQIGVQDVVDYLVANGVYPEATNDENYESNDNLLNQFVTYHFLPERLSTDHLLYHWNENGYNTATKELGVAVEEFYATMGNRRLLKIYESKESKGVFLNRFPILDNRRKGNYHEIGCEPQKEGVFVGEPNMEGENNVRNAIVYPIEKLLFYDDQTRDNLQKQRIRWNVTAMWPEFMNNDIRSSPITDARHKNVYIPTDKEYKYLDDVDIDNETLFYYWTGRGEGWQNMQGDEMTIRGLLDCTMRLPPVPRNGVYEFRFAIQCGGNSRGMVQVYFGSSKDRLAVTGIPMDLRQGTKYRYTTAGNIPSDIGFEFDTGDEDYDSEVDKRMHNNGFMKGCKQYNNDMRSSDICVRRILTRTFMEADKTYYVRFKTVMDDPTRYFYMDYLEYCAKEVYDNPVQQEDIW